MAPYSYRINTSRGPTYSLKLLFRNLIATTVRYAGIDKLVHQYIPPFKSLICFKCAKPGHKADFCRGRKTCPKCGRAHSKWKCNVDTNIATNRRCVNFQGQHSAAWEGCKFNKEAKQIMKIQKLESLPRYEARNML